MPNRLYQRDAELMSRHRVLAWVLFSWTAGSVNGGAFRACRNFVTHVTGTLTSMGIDASEIGLALEYCAVFASFIIGAMLGVTIIEFVVRGRTHLVVLPFVISFALLMIAAFAGHAGMFGPFGDVVETPGSFMLLVLLSGAMGIQNATISALTKNAIRTTHLTGPTTDLAANIVHATIGRPALRDHNVRWVFLRLAKMFAFVVGAFTAAKYAPALGYRVFSLGAISMLVGVVFVFAPLFVGGAENVSSSRVRAEEK